MKIEKLKINKEKFDINLKFYFLLKNLIKAKLTESQINNVLSRIDLYDDVNDFKDDILEYCESSLKGAKSQYIIDIINILNYKEDLSLLYFSLNLLAIKKLLLEESKLINSLRREELKKLEPLSLEYDKLSVYEPYTRRVNGALLALSLFDKVEKNEVNFISNDATNFLASLSERFVFLKSKGLETNQIFLILFAESINQSIISNSGINYEDRLKSVLVNIGISRDTIKKYHDADNKELEYDFIFSIGKKKIGIGAKRTLREGYKQFLSDGKKIEADKLITVTIGMDLNKEKALKIRKGKVYIFVADEIYQSKKFLQEIEGVYSVKDLTLDLLKKI